MTQLTREQAHTALTSAGWSGDLLDTMTAIGAQESTLKVDQVGGPNRNGTYDYGWLQINSAKGYDKNRLLSDPVYNAQCALAIYKTQGLNAWVAYTSGDYKKYLPPSKGGPQLSQGHGAWFLIHDLQMFLNAALNLQGADRLSGTGYWGPTTQKYWEQYQALHAIEKGVCGPAYWKQTGL